MEFPNHKKFTQGSLVQLKHGNGFFFFIGKYIIVQKHHDFFIVFSVVNYSAEAP